MNPQKKAAPAKATASSLKLENSISKGASEQALLSMFSYAKARKPSGEISVRQFFDDIKGGKYQDTVAKVRQLSRQGNKTEADKAKLKLPAVILSGLVTSGGHRQAMQENRFQHSGLLQIDLDQKDLGDDTPDLVRKTLADDPHILFSFISPSGTGVKAAMVIPICKSEGEHKACFLHAESYMQDTYGWQIDQATKNSNRLCFVSDDPDARWNDDAITLPKQGNDEPLLSRKDPSWGGREREYSSILSTSSTSSTSSTYQTKILEKIQQAAQSADRLEKNKPLAKQYRQWVEKRFIARQGDRNSMLVAMVTFLSRAVGERNVLELVRVFWELNQDVFVDGLEQHMTEAEAHLRNTIAMWWSSLPSHEREQVVGLPIKHQEAFRICRDLAGKDLSDAPKGQFYLSCGDLGSRINTSGPQAQRILSMLEAAGCLTIHEKGTQRAEGKQGKATTFKWLWSLPEC